MGRGIENLEAAYNIFFTAALVILAVLMVFCLVRAIMGPRVADRIVAANMMGTLVIVIIAILALRLGEGYLVDICIIYAMISFLAVIVLTKVYTGVYLGEKRTDIHGDTGMEEVGTGKDKTEDNAVGNSVEKEETMREESAK